MISLRIRHVEWKFTYISNISGELNIFEISTSFKHSVREFRNTTHLKLNACNIRVILKYRIIITPKSIIQICIIIKDIILRVIGCISTDDITGGFINIVYTIWNNQIMGIGNAILFHCGSGTCFFILKCSNINSAACIIYIILIHLG